MSMSFGAKLLSGIALFLSVQKASAQTGVALDKTTTEILTKMKKGKSAAEKKFIDDLPVALNGDLEALIQNGFDNFDVKEDKKYSSMTFQAARTAKSQDKYKDETTFAYLATGVDVNKDGVIGKQEIVHKRGVIVQKNAVSIGPNNTVTLFDNITDIVVTNPNPALTAAPTHISIHQEGMHPYHISVDIASDTTSTTIGDKGFTMYKLKKSDPASQNTLDHMAKSLVTSFLTNAANIEKNTMRSYNQSLFIIQPPESSVSVTPDAKPTNKRIVPRVMNPSTGTGGLSKGPTP
jgi:hypothetical protein